MAEDQASTADEQNVTRSFNGRLIILLALTVLIALLIASPIANHLSQQADLTEQEKILSQAKATNKKLKEQKKRQEDPEYVKQQARQRLHMAMPGEVPYIVVGNPTNPQSDFTPVDPNTKDPGWTGNLLESLDSSNAYQEKLTTQSNSQPSADQTSSHNNSSKK